MSLGIATNIAALRASASASSINSDLEISMTRLSTGKRINSAADDAAGVAIASRLSSEIRGTDQAIRNALDGQALIDTAEGGHKEIEEILQRMREVAIQSANDTNSSQDRGNLQAEMDALMSEIDRIAVVTTWAGNSVMDGGESTSKTFSLQVGAATGTKNQIAVTINAMDSTNLAMSTTAYATANHVPADDYGTKTGLTSIADNSTTKDTLTLSTGAVAAFNLNTLGAVTSTTALDGTGSNKATVAAELAASVNGTQAYIDAGISANVNTSSQVELNFGTAKAHVHSALGAKTAIGLIDTAIKTVNTQRSSLGAISNRLTHTVSNMTNISTNLSAARGGIEDADFAMETTELAKNQILQQASTAMLAQANASKQNVLSLLQG